MLLGAHHDRGWFAAKHSPEQCALQPGYHQWLERIGTRRTESQQFTKRNCGASKEPPRAGKPAHGSWSRAMGRFPYGRIG